MADDAVPESWTNLSQNTPMETNTPQYEQDEQSRSSLDKLISQAQNNSQTQSQTRNKKKRPKTKLIYDEISSDSDSGPSQSELPPKRRNTQSVPPNQPTMILINSPDVQLSKINPIRIAKALNNATNKDHIKSVTKNNQGGI